MAKGINTYKGLAVPLSGNFEITAKSAALEDVMTLTHAASGTGDYIVCQTANGSEVWVVEDGGKVTVGGGGATITSGGLTVTAGAATIAAGALTATAGDVVVGDGMTLRWSSAPLLTTRATTGLTDGSFFPMSRTSIYYLAFKGATSVLFEVAMTDN